MENNQPEKKIIETLIAREIKSIFYLVLCGLVLGILSFPVLYYYINEVPKYDNYAFPLKTKPEAENTYKTDSSGTLTLDELFKRHANDKEAVSSFPEGIDLTDFPFPWYGTDMNSVYQNIALRKSSLTKKSFSKAISVFVFVSILLIVIKYLILAVRWVNTASIKN